MLVTEHLKKYELCTTKIVAAELLVCLYIVFFLIKAMHTCVLFFLCGSSSHIVFHMTMMFVPLTNNLFMVISLPLTCILLHIQIYLLN